MDALEFATADAGGSGTDSDADMVTLPLQSQYRVKLYQLDTSGQWDDRGTGFVFTYHAMGAISPSGALSSSAINAVLGGSGGVPSAGGAASVTVPRFVLGSGTTEPLVLIVRSDEHDDAVLVNHRVEADLEYDRQGDTILTWSEADTEFAISFQEQEGCADAWEQIARAQGKNEEELLAGSESVEPDALSDAAASLPMVRRCARSDSSCLCFYSLHPRVPLFGFFSPPRIPMCFFFCVYRGHSLFVSSSARARQY